MVKVSVEQDMRQAQQVRDQISPDSHILLGGVALDKLQDLVGRQQTSLRQREHVRLEAQTIGWMQSLLTNQIYEILEHFRRIVCAIQANAILVQLDPVTVSQRSQVDLILSLLE